MNLKIGINLLLTNYDYRAGITFSVIASLIFGIIPWLINLINIDGNTLFSLRIIIGFVFLTAYFSFSKKYIDLFNSAKDILKSPKRLSLLLIGACLIGVQWWIFIWAPANGLTKELSLGYFMLPLSTALLGKLIFKERINFLRRIAISLALIGLVIELMQHHSISWVSVIVFGGYPLYFTIRKMMKEKVASILFLEHLCLIPVSILFFKNTPNIFSSLYTTPYSLVLILLFGIVGIISVFLYIQASMLLPLSLFGMLSYLEPSILFVVATIVIHEQVETSHLIFYGFIWSATLISLFDSFKIFIDEPKSSKHTKKV
ncbi:EamA family transporter RarD [Parashewanella spongiae]|uniref:EamA family transporter RarD n=1 Tax=Parashewanella spongiae TaxID=342950 RepID=UPI0014052309|nr:EamA family transporter RarD [Parashewanella spongiae]MCL1079336.1 EamA family transporter RarD [Parashewanella spongiae]